MQRESQRKCSQPQRSYCFVGTTPAVKPQQQPTMSEPTYKTAENDLEIQLSSLLKRLINGLYGSAQQKF
jgi:hypothetical protein